MSWVSWVSFAVCFGIVLTSIRREADYLSPARIFGFVWSLAIGLTDLKLSRYQVEWTTESWMMLLLGIMSFLVGTLIAYVLNLGRPMVPIRTMRQVLLKEEIDESRLFWIITASVAVYGISYIVIYLVKGFLPVFVVGTKISRTDFYVFGFGVLINSTAFIILFTLLYHLLVKGNKARKRFLLFITIIAVGSYFLLLQRFQIVMAAMLCFTVLYYGTHRIRLTTVVPLVAGVTGFFYWISSLRLGSLVATYTYYSAKMKFPKAYTLFTEPYMYLAMNLENFARAVNRLDHFTFGYFTFDFVTAAAGLKYWISDYFNLDRTPYLISGYNTYTAFWQFYRDFGIPGLVLIPLLLGFGIGIVYYRMRSRPTIGSVTAYGVMVFVMFISYFNFPAAFLWFEYNVLAMYWIVRLIKKQPNRGAGSLMPSLSPAGGISPGSPM